MSFERRPVPPLDEESFRSRKKIHETPVNEAFDNVGYFSEMDDNNTLWFWHKVRVPDLFEAPSAYQLVEDDDRPLNIPDRPVPTVRAIIDLNAVLCIEVTYFAGPILTSNRKEFCPVVEFQLKEKEGTTIPNELKGCRVKVTSKLLAKFCPQFYCRHKFALVVAQTPFTRFETKSELLYDPEEVIAHEVQVELDELEPEEDEETESKLPRGLVNLGVTCYMNSYLQTIFHLKKFRYFINRLDNEGTESSFVFCLQQLFYTMERMRSGAATTRPLVHSFGWNLHQIFTQQDVQEFSFMFLDAIEKKSQKLGISEPINKELFQGVSETFISCVNIEFESKREEVFTDVQLTVKDTRTLSEALENYLGFEELIGENAYDTERFGKQDAVKGLRFKRLPKVLIFHLSRFEFDYATGENIKLLGEFIYPETIDMAPYIGGRKGSMARRKSSVGPLIGEEQGVVEGRVNGNGHIQVNGNHLSETPLAPSHTLNSTNHKAGPETPVKPKPSSEDKKPPGVSDSPDVSAETYRLFGVFVHFGYNSNSGHYEVYLKIEDQWFEFNDEKVLPVDFEEVKRRSFGGKRRVHVLDIHNFRLRERLRDSDGHAYMLVYIRAADYDDIVRNRGQTIPYPENVELACKVEIAALERESFRQRNFRVFLMTKETFVGGPSGRGSLFFTRALYDHEQCSRFKKGGKYKKFHVKQTILNEDLLATLAEQQPLQPGERAFYFLWYQKTHQFVHIDFSHFQNPFDDNFKQYIYLHVEKRASPVEVEYPSFMIWKLYDQVMKVPVVKDIRLIGAADSLESVRTEIEQFEGRPAVVFLEELGHKRLQALDDLNPNANIIEIIRPDHHWSINFVFGTPESSELFDEISDLWAQYRSTLDLRIRSLQTADFFHLQVKSQATFKEIFTFLRTELKLLSNTDVVFELSFQTKSHNWMKFIEDERDGLIASSVLHNDIFYTIQPASRYDKTDSPESEGSHWLCLKYFPLRAVSSVELSGFISEPEKEEDRPTDIDQLLEEVVVNTQIQAVVREDLTPLLLPNMPFRIARICLFTNFGYGFKQINGPKILSRVTYCVMPLLQIADEMAENASEGLLQAELRFTSNTRRPLRTPIYLIIPERLTAAALEQVLETLVLQVAMTNPENQEPFEAEYIRRNLRLSIFIGQREYELEQLKDLVLKDLGISSIHLCAAVSTDSFRNNIKINI